MSWKPSRAMAMNAAFLLKDFAQLILDDIQRDGLAGKRGDGGNAHESAFESADAPRLAIVRGASVEAAELNTVQGGEHAEENHNGQNRDHGRLVSAKVKTA